MKTWIAMVSCSDAGFESLHNLLRTGSGCHIYDNVILPETFDNFTCSIEFRYYSENRITLSAVPKPSKYHGKNKQIKNWAQTGYAAFSNFKELKKFLKSFKDDTSSEAPASTVCSDNQPLHPAGNTKESDPVPPPPKMHYDKESITIPKTNQSFIVLDKDKLILNLKDEIFGQDENIEKIAHLVCNHLATKRKTRPLSIFLYGPTGTGKSALAEAIVEEINKLVDQNHRMAYRPVDCTHYQERADISRLTGAAPGYIGFDEPGVFSILEDNPRTIFVFEEIEKAASNVTEVIMQAMETGKQETNGKTLKNGLSYYDLSNCVIFFTSNINIEEKKKNIGFKTYDAASTEHNKAEVSSNIARKIGDETKEAKIKLAETGKFRREVISRMHAIIKFNPLSGDVIKDIVAKCIRNTAAKSHMLYITEIDTPIMQEFINATFGEVEQFGVRSLRTEVEYYFNDAFCHYSHTHDDYAHIKVSGTLDNIIIAPSSVS